MKLRLLLLLLLLIPCMRPALGQKNLYLTLSTDSRYSFAPSSLYRGVNFDNYDYTLYSLSPVSSYGNGIYYALGAGLPLNKKIETGINIAYKQNNVTVAYMEYKSAQLSTHVDFNSSLVLANPYIRFNKTPNGNFGKFVSFYFSVGMVAGVAGVTITDDKTENSVITHTVYSYKKRRVIGLSSGIGIVFKLTPRWQFFEETNIIGLSFKPKKSTVKTTENGTEKSYEVQYQKTNHAVSEDPSMPFSSVGITFGIRFNFIKAQQKN